MSEAAVVAAPVVDAPAPVAPPVEVVATPVAPAPVPVPEAPPTSTAEAIKQAKQRVKDRIAGTATEPTAEAAPTDDPAAPTDGTAPDAPTEGEAPTDAPPTDAPTWRKVSLAGHPISGSGVPEIAVQTEAEERVLKGLLNGSYVRVQENEQLKRDLAQERDARLALERQRVGNDAVTQAAERFKQTPEYKARIERYQQIASSVGEEAAQDYWKGVRAEFEAFAESEKTSKIAEVETAQHEADGQAFAQQAWNYAWQGVPAEIRSQPNFPRWFNEEITLLNMACEQGVYDSFAGDTNKLHQAFAQNLLRRAHSDPAVLEMQRRSAAAAQAATQQTQQQTLAQQQIADQARIAREAVEAVKREAANRRAATPPHPLGPVAGSAVAGVSTTLTPNTDMNSLTKEQARQAAKQSARSMAAAGLRR